MNIQVFQSKAEIVEPMSDAKDIEKKFTAGLSTAVHLVARLHNVQDVQAVRVQVCTPAK